MQKTYNWTYLQRAFVLALAPKKVIFAFVGLIFSIFLISLINWAANYQLGLTFSSGHMLFSPRYFAEFFIFTWRYIIQAGPLFVCLVLSAYYVILVFVWSFFGAAITRASAIEICREDVIDSISVISFVREKYRSFFWSFLGCDFSASIPILIIVLFSLGIRIPVIGHFWGVILALFLPIILFLAFISFVITFGGMIGWPIFFPVIAVEGTNAFDSITRVFNYIFSRFWHFVFYQLSFLMFMAISFSFVFLMSGFMLFVVKYAIIAGGGGSLSLPSGSMCAFIMSGFPHFDKIANIVYVIWLFLFISIVFSYLIAYFFTSQTIVYLLIRKKADFVGFNEVYYDDDYMLSENEDIAFKEQEEVADSE